VKILLIAYDFPPVPSPQSIRWAYLVGELARQGHDVQVLAPAIGGYGPGGLPDIPPEVIVHRAWPGPYAAFREWVAGCRAHAKAAASQSNGVSGDSFEAPSVESGIPTALNWKGRVRHRLVAPWRRVRSRLLPSGLVPRLLSLVLFPDQRAEWMPWAKRSMQGILRSFAPDVVITSHEPACALPLGIVAAEAGYPWVADLGDPVLAPYTPTRWRAHAFALEHEVCMHARAITMTSKSAASALVSRHPEIKASCHVLTQGFDARVARATAGSLLGDSDTLEILYTGSFYAFRDATPVFDAVARASGVRLSIASISLPEALKEMVLVHPDKFRLLGFIPHKAALALQREYDLLLNIANDDPVQVPGKLYEYLGSGTPILHVGGVDAAAELVAENGSGWCEPQDVDRIQARLEHVAGLKSKKLLAKRAANERIQAYSWESIAAELLHIAGLALATGMDSSRQALLNLVEKDQNVGS
jgi:glycosyltransferase involved in cell wall biosynthesis